LIDSLTGASGMTRLGYRTLLATGTRAPKPVRE
jgi:hypothetical protein